jgi:hypothetical protein
MSPHPARREAILKFVIVSGIFLCAGPEIAAALELQILLEMLGVTLFAIAFIAGARLALLTIGEKLRSFALPIAPVVFVFVAYLEWWLATATAMFTSVHAMWMLVA